MKAKTPVDCNKCELLNIAEEHIKFLKDGIKQRKKIALLREEIDQLEEIIRDNKKLMDQYRELTQSNVDTMRRQNTIIRELKATKMLVGCPNDYFDLSQN